jgi:serine protease
MKNYLNPKAIGYLAICALLFSTACERTDLPEKKLIKCYGDQPVLVTKPNPASVPAGSPISKENLDRWVINTLNERQSFEWNMADLPTIWSALQEKNHTLAVGYKPAGMKDVDPIIHQIDLKSGEWKQVHDALIDLIISELNKQIPGGIKWEDILVEDDPILPILTIKLENKEVLTSLYNLENVRYLEPLDYWPSGNNYRVASSSGCSGSSVSVNSADFSTITPGCLLPWNFNNLNIPSAWNLAQGSGQRIGVDFTYGTSAYTTCTHGTSMSGLAVGPRNAQNATTGVAYQAGLHLIRACADVVLDESAERTGVKNALVKMGDRTDVNIVSMSIGTPFGSSVLLDGCNYANNKGKMLFAAAGTSTGLTSWWGVIYPAAYSVCNAVTGVNESGSKCATCHDGRQVDFTVPMERNANSDRNSLTLALSGNGPTYIGGSSAATATAAGIAALIWSVKPGLTRSQVFTCLRNTAQFYPNLSSSKGWGNLNASAAVTMAQGL